MKKLLFTLFAVYFMQITIGICQPALVDFNLALGTAANWPACAGFATMEFGNSTGYGGPGGDNIGEIDTDIGVTGGMRTICRSISGFTPGQQYTLTFDAGRRPNCTVAAGGKRAPIPMSIIVTIAGQTFTVTRSNTVWGLTSSTICFTAGGTGTEILNIVPQSLATLTAADTYGGAACTIACPPCTDKPIGDGSYGMIVDNFVFAPVTTPVGLLNFKAIKNGSEVEISWQTAMEINNDYFTVEKSVTGIDFTALGVIDGSGNSQSILNYQTIDPSPYYGTSYYRLKQTDFDGKFSYSDIVTVNFNENKINAITAYPNPFDQEINLMFRSDLEKNIIVNIIDVIGNTVYSSVHTANQEITIGNDLSAGVYIISVQEHSEIKKIKIIKL